MGFEADRRNVQSALATLYSLPVIQHPLLRHNNSQCCLP